MLDLDATMDQIMRRMLPPLLALRVFEAAGRLTSFARAADELCVSPGAVSRQIHALEIFLGQRLFERLTRQVRLTTFGAAYFATVTQSIEMIEEATRQASRAQQRLTIDAMPTTANLCLLPWISSFTESTRIEVHVQSSMTPVDFVSSSVDVAIRVGALPGRVQSDLGRIPHVMTRDWSTVRAEYLWDEVLIPVCSRTWLRQRASFPGHPQQWTAEDLISTVSRPRLWDDWFHAQGRGRAPVGDGLQVGHFYVALQMARQHRGIALVPTVHWHALEWRDEMACPCAGVLKSVGGFYALYRDADRHCARIKTFLRWLRCRGDASAPYPEGT